MMARPTAQACCWQRRQSEDMQVPQLDVEYPVTLGDSFDGKRSSLAVLRYDFQPASVSRTACGVYQQSEDNRVRQGCMNFHEKKLY